MENINLSSIRVISEKLLGIRPDTEFEDVVPGLTLSELDLG